MRERLPGEHDSIHRRRLRRSKRHLPVPKRLHRIAQRGTIPVPCLLGPMESPELIPVDGFRSPLMIGIMRIPVFLRPHAVLIGLVLLTSTASGQVKTRVGVSSIYDSNPFHLRESWKDSFDSDRSPGERFDGFETISDVITTLEGSVSRRWKLEGGSRVETTAKGSFDAYAFNSVATYAELKLGADWDLRKAGQAGLDISWIPSRQRRNYHDNSGAVSGAFEPGEFSEIDTEVSYRYRIRSGLSTQAFAGLVSRSYDAPHANRDRVQIEAGVGVDLRVARRRHVLLEAALVAASTGDDLEDGIPVDRSFDAVQVRLDYEASAFKVWAKMRNRSYSTEEARDLGHFDRSDVKWTVGSEWERSLTDKLKMTVNARYENNSSRRASGLPSEDVIPYTDFSVGGGLRLSL